MPQRFDEIYKALSDAHRRRILAAVCREPMVAGDLARLVRLAPNAVSFHLKWLRSAGLVTVQRQGKYLHYSADARGIGTLREHVNELFLPSEEAAARRSEWRPRANRRGSYPLVRREHAAATRSGVVHYEGYAGAGTEGESLPTELL